MKKKRRTLDLLGNNLPASFRRSGFVEIEVKVILKKNERPRLHNDQDRSESE